MTTKEYQDPKLILAQKTLKDVLAHSRKGEKVKDIIETYNTEIEKKLGTDSADYILKINNNLSASEKEIFDSMSIQHNILESGSQVDTGNNTCDHQCRNRRNRQ